MTFLPIVGRELRQQARRSRTYWVRFSAVLLGTMLTLGLLSPSFHGLIPPTDTGRVLFAALGGLAFGYALLAGVFATADCISEEKRDGTLGLLFLTDLRGHDVVAGKLVARSLNAFYGMAAVFPVLAVALLIGGVTAGEFWRAVVVLLNTLFLSVSVGLWVSVQCRDGRLAMAGTLLTLAIPTLFPWVFVNLSTPLTTGYSPLLLVSPLLPVVLVADSTFALRPSVFVVSLLLQHAFSWLALAVAAMQVRASWQLGGERKWSFLRKVGGVRQETLNEEELAARSQERARWLEQNPVLWLAQGSTRWSGNALLMLVLAMCGAIMGCLTLRSAWEAPWLAMLTAWVLHAVVKVWLAADATRLLHEARQAGVLELLLVSPLRQSDVVEGLLTTIKRRFGPPVALVLVADIVLVLVTATESVGWALGMSLVFFIMAGIFLADAYTLTWVGLWQGMVAPTLTRAFLGTLLRVLLLPWGVFLLVSAGDLSVRATGFGGPDTFLAVWFAVSYVIDGVLCAVSINRITMNFREMAAQEQSPGFLRELWRSLSPGQFEEGGTKSPAPQSQTPPAAASLSSDQ